MNFPPEEEKISCYPEARICEAEETRVIWDKGRRGKVKTVDWHFVAESGRSCALLQFFTFHPFLFTPLLQQVKAVPCLFLLVWFIRRWHIDVFKPEGRIWGLRYTEKPYMVKAEEFFKPFLISNLFSLGVVVMVVTIRLDVHTVSH